MPELPEVETTRQGLSPYCVGATLAELTVREPRLRWRVSPEMSVLVKGRKINALDRRGKYLLFRLEGATGMILHLGMSGSVRVAALGDCPLRHDHVDIVLNNARILRYHDPRRFGSLHYVAEPIESHPLLRRLGPEPLSDSFNGRHLFELSRGRRMAVKQFIMDSHVVVGVGNIYAAESLFSGGHIPNSRGRACFGGTIRQLGNPDTFRVVRGDRNRWHDPARFYKHRRTARLFSAELKCIWPRRNAMQALQRYLALNNAWAARNRLLPAVPALAAG